MTNMRFRWAALWAVVVVLAGWLPVHAQQPFTNTVDTVFTDIQLTNEGVTATDTAGNRWTYDFDSLSFVPDKTAALGGRRGEGGYAEGVAGPVEERCTERKIVKPLQNHVLIGYDEYVDGDIIAYGRVTIKGWVKGSVQSISGRVLVTEYGQVDGDIKAPEIMVDSAAVVKGQQLITDPFDFPAEMLSRPFSADGLVIVLAFTIALIIFGFLIVVLLPRQFVIFRDTVTQFKARTIFVGVIFFFLMAPIMMLVTITIVGLIVLPFVPLAYIVAMFTGVLSVGSKLGNMVVRRFREGSSLLIDATVGTVLFMLQWLLVAILLGSSSSVAEGFGIFFLVVAILITCYPVFGGIGAAVLTRFGNRPYAGSIFKRGDRGTEAPTPAPPPIPDMPRFTPPPPVPPVPQPPQDNPPPRPGPLGPDFKPPLSADNR